jgi:hypothetical protein
MGSGRIRRSARRGIAAAVLGWLAVAAVSVLMAPSASAAPSATVTIQNLTPPAVSVDQGGTVTFVNGIPAQNKGGISIPLAGTFSATIHTDVTVAFFGQTRPLQPGQSTSWTFDDPATTGTITYTYRIVPQAGLTAPVANQVVSAVAASLPALPAPTPYVVQTILPDVPNLPGANLPQLPTVTVPTLPGTPEVVDPTNPTVPTTPTVPGTPADGTPTGPTPEGIPGAQYNYELPGGTPNMTPANAAAAAAFDPSRYFVPGESLGGVDGGSGSGEGAGGQAGSYDGASVPVFGQLAGLDSAALDEEAAADAEAAGQSAPALPAAALAAVVALAAVTAALVRTHQAQRESRR